MTSRRAAATTVRAAGLAVLARLMGLREHGVRLQNLVIDAEYRFVELLNPPMDMDADGVSVLRYQAGAA